MGYRPRVESRGLRFASILSDEAHRQVLADPGLWNRHRAFGVFVRGWMCPLVEPIVSLVESQPRPQELVLLAAMAAGPGARTAEQRTGARMVTLWVDPASVRSAIAPPVLAGLRVLPRLPLSLRKGLLWAMDRNADRLAAGPINRVRLRAGLPPVRNVLDWLASDHQQLGLFPEWYCPRQRDWPAHLDLVGFPLPAARGALEPEAEAYLAAGAPPVVITFGTSMRHGQALFSAAVEACRRLGLRPMVVAPQEDGVPDDLPEGCRVFRFLPFADLLPRARALIHHAGTGTGAQALAAGIPQIGLPLAHDHFDNLARIQRLNCGDGIWTRRTPSRLATLLAAVLESPTVAAACRLRARQLAATDGVGLACDALERGPSSEPVRVSPRGLV